MVSKHSIVSFCLSMMVYVTDAIDFKQLNIAYRYDPTAEVELKNRVTSTDKEVSVFLRFKADSVFIWNLDFFIQDGYESEAHTALTGFTLDTLQARGECIYLKLTRSKPKKPLMVVKVSKNEKAYYFDVSLSHGSYSPPPIYPVDGEGLPLFENYFNTSTYRWRGSASYLAMEYAENFDPADPPMATMSAIVPSVKPESVFSFSDSVNLKEDHFYVVRVDETAVSGVTMTKQAAYYPKFKRLNELARATWYIMNENERKELRGSDDLKKTFDAFWIRTYKTKFRARNAIRNYFTWIEQANYLFTDFKQGWKTDRGMLFIVFGTPDEVYRTDHSEEWYYDSGPSFEFTVISTFFASKTYALRRKSGFENAWIEYVVAIRRGLNE